MENDFVSVYSSTATSAAPGTWRIEGGSIAVEGEVGVREVVHDDDLVLAREGDDTLHEVELDGRRGRVVRERQHDHARPGRASSHACSRFSKRFSSGPIGTWKTLAPASIGPWMWIG